MSSTDRRIGNVLERGASLVLLILLLGLSWPLFAEKGLIVQTDYPGWTAIVQMLDEEVLADCRWFWAVPFPRINAGEILGQPYSLSLIAPWLLTRVVPREWAFKTVIFLGYVTLGFGFYCFAAPKSSRFAAVLGAYLCVLENLYHVNHGMWYNSLSIGLAFFFFVALERLACGFKARYWVAAVLLLALTMFAHPLGAVMAFAGWFGFAAGHVLPRHRPGRRNLMLILSVPVLATGIASPQVLGTVIGSPVGVGAAPAHQYIPFTMLKLYLGRLVMGVSLYGLIQALRYNRSTLWITMPVLVTAGVLYRNWVGLIPFDFPTKNGLAGFADRFLLVGSAATLVLFVAGLARLQVLWRSTTASPRAKWIAGMTLAAVLLGTVHLGLRRVLAYQPATLVSERAVTDHQDFQALCGWIRENIDHQTERIYVEDTFSRVRDFPVYPANRLGRAALRIMGRYPTFETHYMALICVATPCQQVNGFPVYQNPFNDFQCCNGKRLFSTELSDLTAEKTRERLWALNCRHIVAFSDSMREFLGAFGFLRCVCEFGRFCVFTWDDMPAHYAWTSEPDLRVVPTTKVSSVLYRIDLSGIRANTIYVSLQHHANWKASLDGRPVEIRPWMGLMRINLPSGQRGTLTVCYQFHRTLPLTVAMLSLAATLLLAGAMRNRGVQPFA